MAQAELIADRGEGAESEDFFRSRCFYDAEGVTHTLRIEAEGMSASVALVVREVPGSDRRDAASPYGYPGGVVDGGPAPAAGEVDWKPTGLVSIFARERLSGEAWLASARERSAVLVHDPARPRRIRGRLAEQIRSSERRGWTVEELPGPEVSEEARAAFEEAYAQTMRRTGAGERYLFGSDYFRSLLTYPASWLVAAHSPAGSIGAGAIAALSDGHLHYYLGGTIDDQLAESPFKNVVEGMIELAERLEVPLNLGGGVRPGDGLEAFKRGFANSELAFRTQEIVGDSGDYERLAAGRPRSGFFPAYRS